LDLLDAHGSPGAAGDLLTSRGPGAGPVWAADPAAVLPPLALNAEMDGASGALILSIHGGAPPFVVVWTEAEPETTEERECLHEYAFTGAKTIHVMDGTGEQASCSVLVPNPER
jgi:hypothetical protein